MRQDEWISVRDESELRPGMAVQVRPCGWCGKVETITLVKASKRTELWEHKGPGVTELAKGSVKFSVAGKCDDKSEYVFTGAIAEGRIYRLSDLPSDESKADDVATERQVTNKRTLATEGQRR